MVTERTIINALIIGASLILVPFLISETLFPVYLPEYVPELLFGLAVGLILAFFYLKETLSVAPLLWGAIGGSLNFLPIPLGASQVACILLVLYYITGYVIIHQTRVKIGKAEFFWPMMIITLIILYHNHELQVGALGGDTEGGKPALFIYLTAIAYFCGINVRTPSVKFLSKIPLYSLILTILSGIPYLLSTYIPALAPYLYHITDTVNVEAYVDSLATSGEGGADETMSRLISFGAIGTSLQLYLLCHYPIGTWLRPERWWVAGLSLICVILSISCGYRSDIFGFALLTMAGAWAYYSWRAVVLPAAVTIAMLLFFIASSDNVIHVPVNKLPSIAQRTLSFLPGDWDPDAIESGNASNNFRKNMQDVYLQEYLQKSPFFGNGFSIDKKEFQYYEDALKGGTGREWADNSYLESKVFIEGKMYHTGWISVYDCVGIIGSIAFVFFGWNEIRFIAHFIFGPKADRRSPLFPLYVWIFAQLVVALISFFTVFGDFKTAFMGQIIFAIVLSQLYDIENTTEVPIVPLDRKKQIEFGRAGAAGYGVQSKY